jgi:hypothetical protein
MKLYAKGDQLSTVEGQQYDLLIGVSANLAGRGSMWVDQWGSGWIFEADDNFRSYCMLIHGFSPVEITEEEYKLLKLCGRAFFSKERTLDLRKTFWKKPINTGCL